MTMTMTAANHSYPMVRGHPSSAAMFRYCRRLWFTLTLLAAVFVFSYSLAYAQEDNSCSAATTGAQEEFGDASATVADQSDSSSNIDSTLNDNEKSGSSPVNEDDWGTFYDPKNVFCGKFDCYKILGFDHETWGYKPPSLKDITKSYRGLSRKWHPDKNKVKGAREKFVVSRNR